MHWGKNLSNARILKFESKIWFQNIVIVLKRFVAIVVMSQTITWATTIIALKISQI